MKTKLLLALASLASAATPTEPRITLDLSDGDTVDIVVARQ